SETKYGGDGGGGGGGSNVSSNSKRKDPVKKLAKVSKPKKLPQSHRQQQQQCDHKRLKADKANQPKRKHQPKSRSKLATSAPLVDPTGKDLDLLPAANRAALEAFINAGKVNNGSAVSSVAAITASHTDSNAIEGEEDEDDICPICDFDCTCGAVSSPSKPKSEPATLSVSGQSVTAVSQLPGVQPSVSVVLDSVVLQGVSSINNVGASSSQRHKGQRNNPRSKVPRMRGNSSKLSTRRVYDDNDDGDINITDNPSDQSAEDSDGGVSELQYTDRKPHKGSLAVVAAATTTTTTTTTTTNITASSSDSEVDKWESSDELGDDIDLPDQEEQYLVELQSDDEATAASIWRSDEVEEEDDDEHAFLRSYYFDHYTTTDTDSIDSGDEDNNVIEGGGDMSNRSAEVAASESDSDREEQLLQMHLDQMSAVHDAIAGKQGSATDLMLLGHIASQDIDGEDGNSGQDNRHELELSEGWSDSDSDDSLQLEATLEWSVSGSDADSELNCDEDSDDEDDIENLWFGGHSLLLDLDESDIDSASLALGIAMSM
ncbi:hypothetical protein EV182_004256, partial [Spiromyces aspiralis]